MSLRVHRVGHVVLRVRSIEASLPFYSGVLGLREVARRDFGEGPMVFLSTGQSHHDLALVEIGTVPGPGPLHHLALKVGDSLADLAAAKRSVEDDGVSVHMMLTTTSARASTSRTLMATSSSCTSTPTLLSGKPTPVRSRTPTPSRSEGFGLTRPVEGERHPASGAECQEVLRSSTDPWSAESDSPLRSSTMGGRVASHTGEAVAFTAGELEGSGTCGCGGLVSRSRAVPVAASANPSDRKTPSLVVVGMDLDLGHSSVCESGDEVFGDTSTDASAPPVGVGDQEPTSSTSHSPVVRRR